MLRELAVLKSICRVYLKLPDLGALKPEKEQASTLSCEYIYKRDTYKLLLLQGYKFQKVTLPIQGRKGNLVKI